MTRWNRRSVLQAFGTGAAAATLGPVLSACRPAPPGTSARPGQPEVQALVAGASVLAQRALLRELVTGLSVRFARVFALARVWRIGWSFIDADERSFERREITSVTFTAIDDAGVLEECTTEFSPASIQRVAQRLGARAAGTARLGATGRPLGIPREQMLRPAEDPRTASPERWLARVDRLHQRAGQLGSSRIVYRAAYAISDDEEALFIGDGRDWAQRVVRTRAGVLLLAPDMSHRARSRSAALDSLAPSAARTGARGPAAVRLGAQADLGPGPGMHLEEATQSGVLGLEATDIPDQTLDAAADRALRLFSPNAAPEGRLEVVLDPSLVAHILYHCIAPALVADSWIRGGVRAQSLVGQKIASALIRLRDDPRLAGGYGGYYFDDQGRASAPTPLIEAGVLIGPISDLLSARALGVRHTPNARRRGLTAPVQAVASNLWLAPDPAAGAGADPLLAGVERGYLLEGCRFAGCDVRTWRFSARAARAYEIRRGTLTGVVYAGLDLDDEIPQFLQAVRALSSDTEQLGLGGASTLAHAVVSPFVLTRCQVTGRG